MKHQPLKRAKKLKPSQWSMYLVRLTKAESKTQGQKKSGISAQLNQSF